jgi:hypothetical protein
MNNLPNFSHALIGWMRDDEDFDVIAAINNYQFADDGQTLRAIVALIQSNMANSENIVVIHREELVDVLSPADDIGEAWSYQPVITDLTT